MSLFHDHEPYKKTMYVENPVTMQAVKVPTDLNKGFGGPLFDHAIARLPDSGEYKLVCGSFDRQYKLRWYALAVAGWH